MTTDLNAFSEHVLAMKYRYKAAGLFGFYLKDGCEQPDQIADQLCAGAEAAIISDSECTQVLAANLLWHGKVRTTQEAILLVMEVAWVVHIQDIEQAAQSSAILRRIGLKSLPVVGGREWTDKVLQCAKQLGVVTIINDQVDQASWEHAIQG